MIGSTGLDRDRSRLRAVAACVTLGGALVMAGCAPRSSTSDGSSGSPPSSPRSSAGTASATAPAPSPAAGDGWIVLFDGGTTDRFRAYGGDGFPSGRWAVDGDALRTIPGPSVDLLSLDTFADFELEFEWRVGQSGNGGVMYRVEETTDPSWASGPEYQVLDDAGHPDGRVPGTSAAALYGLVGPGAETQVLPAGMYNPARIVVRDGRVEHWLNGELALAYDWRGPDILGRIATSKFHDLPRFMAAAAGHIVLQHHGEEVWYRAIRIRRLDTG